MFEFERANGRKNFPAIIEIASTPLVTYHFGDTLVISGGAAVKASGSTKPTHICATEYTAPATGNVSIPVYPILDGYEWKVPISADPTGLEVGDKVTINTDSAKVTATTGGEAEIVNLYGAAKAGDFVIVKF